MSKDLQGKVAVITGGTTGIGRETAVVFAEQGAKVVVSGRREKEGNETLELVKKAGGEGIFVQCDVAKQGDIANLMGKTVGAYGRIDVAFNNAGIEGEWKPFLDLTNADWDTVMDINLKGVFWCLQAEIRQMLKQGGGGAICNMSSVAGLMGTPWAAPYGASKHGVIALTRTAALEFATKKIRVNAVCPAVITTPMADRLFGDRMAELRDMHALKRFGTPREVAESVLWMCSERSSFMTGHYIVMDGGFLSGPKNVD